MDLLDPVQLLASIRTFFSWVWETCGVWIYQAAVIITVVCFLHFFIKKIFARLRIRLKETKRIWGDALCEALYNPLITVVWVIGVAELMQRTDAIIYVTARQHLFFSPKMFQDIGIILCLGWFLVRCIQFVSDRMLAVVYVQDDKTTIHTVKTLLLICVAIIISIGALQAIGLNIAGVLAFGGVGGIIIGFAAKDLLANIFGGLMVHLDCPFVVGEWIRSPDKQVEGTVEHIGWRQTRILTLSKVPLYVPNSHFANISIENLTRMHNRVIKEILGLRYQDIDVLPEVVKEMREYVEFHPGIDKTKPALVHFTAFGPSSLDCIVHAFTIAIERSEYLKVREEIFLNLIAIIHKYKADVAFPSQTIYFQDDASEEGLSAISKQNN